MGSEANLDQAKDMALRGAHALYEALLAMQVPPEIIEQAMTGYARSRSTSQQTSPPKPAGERPRGKRLTLQPDPHMAWIYKPEYRDDPQAKDLRERRSAALRSMPPWMREMIEE